MARVANKFSAHKEELIRVAITGLDTDRLGTKQDIFFKINFTKPNRGDGPTEHLPIIFSPDETKEIYQALKARYESPKGEHMWQPKATKQPHPFLTLWQCKNCPVTCEAHDGVKPRSNRPCKKQND